MFSKFLFSASSLHRSNGKNNAAHKMYVKSRVQSFLSFQRNYYQIPTFERPNCTLFKITPENKPELFIIQKRYKHDDEAPQYGYQSRFWDWEKLLALIGGFIGIYLSFLIWGWNFRFTSLREFDQKHNNEEAEKKQKLLQAFLLDNLPERPSGINDSEYYELICLTIAKKYAELKVSDPDAASKLYSAAFSVLVRFKDGRLLFETLKVFHKVGSPLKIVEKSVFGSNSEQLFEDEIVGRYCYRVQQLVRGSFPIIAVENFLSGGNHAGSDEELLEAVSWYSAKCKCSESDIYTLVNVEKSQRYGYLPNHVDMKNIYQYLESKMPEIVKAKAKVIKRDDKDVIIKRQRHNIKELEDKCTQLQIELHKTKDLYLYSSLKYMMSNKEHREEIMKSNQKSNAEITKKLTKLSEKAEKAEKL